MEHVAIFGIVVNLIIGFWAAFYAYQAYKSYAYPFLQSIVHYTVFCNLGIFVFLIYIYLNTNLPENHMQNRFPFFKDLGFMIATLCEIGMVTSMFRINVRFREKDISPQFKRWILTGIALLVLSYGIRTVLPHQSAFRRWLYLIQVEIYDNFIIFDDIHINIQLI